MFRTMCSVAGVLPSVLPTVRDVLALPAVSAGLPVVRSGEDGLDRTVRWVHVSEISDIAGLLEGGELILTTGIALPGSARELRRYVRDLAAVGVCGLVVELGRRYRGALPAPLIAAAADAGLPLVELHRETPFVAVTQAVHTAILDARMRELVAYDDRERHRTLLTALALAGDVPVEPADLVSRADALGVPLRDRVITGAVVRTRAPAPPPAALLRDLANRSADTLRAQGVAALVGLLDDHHVAVLMSQPDDRRVDPVLQRLADQVHAAGGHRGPAELVLGVGASVHTVAQAAASIREAVRVSATAATLAPRRGWYRAAELGLHGLVHDLREAAALRGYVARELAALDGHDDADHLREVLTAYCRNGGNKTATAAALFVSRASLYDRLAKVERVLGVDLGDADVVLGLHFALLARATLAQPEAAVRAFGG